MSADQNQRLTPGKALTHGFGLFLQHEAQHLPWNL